MRTLLLLLLSAPFSAQAFCGFYVSGAGSKLFNDASMVVLLREGTRTVLSIERELVLSPLRFSYDSESGGSRRTLGRRASARCSW